MPSTVVIVPAFVIVVVGRKHKCDDVYDSEKRFFSALRAMQMSHAFSPLGMPVASRQLDILK